MKKQLHYFVQYFVIIPLFLTTIYPIKSIQAEPQQKQQVKQLEQRYSLFKKTQKEYNEALEAYEACMDKVCSSEKEAFKTAAFERYQLRSRGAYKKYFEVEHIYQECAKQKCPQEHKNLQQVTARLRNRITGLILGTYFGILGAGILVAAAAVGSVAIAKRTQMNNLIKKYELDDPKDKAILQKFLGSKSIEESLAKGMVITEPLRNALVEIYYGYQPTQEQLDRFNEQLSAYDIVVKPSLR